MYVKLSLKDLNFGSYPPHLTNTYTCGVIIVPNVCNSINVLKCIWSNIILILALHEHDSKMYHSQQVTPRVIEKLCC